MTHACSVYGLGVRINVPLAGLTALQEPARTDVAIELGALPEFAAAGDGEAFYRTEEVDESGAALATIVRIAEGAYYRVDYLDGTRVLIEADGTRVWASGGAGDEDTATYLLGPIMGFVLMLRGVTSLHASAVAIGNRAVVFAGPSGSGKSSLAAAFASRGHAVLCDDVAPLGEEARGFVVRPAYPRLRLWPDTVGALFGSPEAMPRLVPDWDKRFVDLSRAPFAFQRSALPLAAIYMLDTGAGPPMLDAVTGRAAIMDLVGASYTARLNARSARARELELLVRVADRVPVRRLRRGTKLSEIPALCDLVVADMESPAGL